MNVASLPICQACLPDLSGGDAIDVIGCGISFISVNPAHVVDNDVDDSQRMHTDLTLDAALPTTTYKPMADKVAKQKSEQQRDPL
eukprot:979491-Pleurochrysis_carterae.AAC.3